MPNIKSQIKRMRQAERARIRNKSVRSELKTYMKKFEAAIASADAEQATSLLSVVFKKLDKAASKGVIHANTAARQKARLAKKLDALTSAPKASE